MLDTIGVAGRAIAKDNIKRPGLRPYPLKKLDLLSTEDKCATEPRSDP
jgi:hypothetical protein